MLISEKTGFSDNEVRECATSLSEISKNLFEETLQVSIMAQKLNGDLQEITRLHVESHKESK
jgi:hypothetical protein